MTTQTLNLLILEDSEADAKLALQALRQGGFELNWRRVDSESDFTAALDSSLDVIVADYRLPGWTAMDALGALQGTGLDLPFIIVSGTIGEETAVAAMKAGAHDYLIKGKLDRLAAAVEREAREAANRRARRAAERLLNLRTRALEAAANAIVITNREGVIEWINPAFTGLTGYTEDEAIGQTPRILKSGQHGQAFYDQLWDTILAGQVWCGKFINRRKDGSLFSDEQTITPVKDARGEITHFIGIHQDITQREKAEEALRASEARFRTLVEVSPAGIIIHQGGRIRYVNAVYQTVTGYSRDELHAMNFWDVVHPDFQALVKDRGLRRSRGEQVPAEYEFKILPRSGAERWVALRAAQCEFEGQPAVMAIMFEITDRKQAEEALIESESRFRQLAESIHEVFWMTDAAKSQMIYVSSAYEAIWGRSCESLYASPGSWMESIHAEDRGRISQAAITNQIEGIHGLEYRIVRPDGGVRWIHDRAFAVKDSQGRVYRIAGVAEDITEKKKLESQFLRAQRLESIGTLASGISHDLNNILAPIMMATQILRLRSSDPETENLLKLIDENTQRGANVIRQILTFARGVEGKQVEVQLRHLVKEMIQIARETFPKAITIQSQLAPDLWTLVGDSTQLHQVLLNLCVNARDAMPSGGKLSLHASNLEIDEAMARQMPQAKPGPYVVLQVTDSGTGIPPAVLEKIFDPFFTTKAQGKGTGLGLSTVLGIVKGHGGFVQVHSEVGQGTTFKIFLPAQPGSTVRESDTVKTAVPGGRGELILVVEDEEPIRRLARSILTRQGYEVMTAENGVEGLVTFAQQQGKVKAVITDMMMPTMDGLGLVRALKKMEPGIRIMAASGLGSGPSEEFKRVELSALGVERFLSKPYTAEGLLMALHQLLHDLPSTETTASVLSRKT